MILISCFVSFTYTSLIAGFLYGFNKTKREHKLSLLPKSKFSIIIAFRNEEYNLPKLITSLSKLNYPKELFEVLLIDDHSQDKSFSSALTHTDTIENFRVLKSSHKSKKMLFLLVLIIQTTVGLLQQMQIVSFLVRG